MSWMAEIPTRDTSTPVHWVPKHSEWQVGVRAWRAACGARVSPVNFAPGEREKRGTCAECAPVARDDSAAPGASL